MAAIQDISLRQLEYVVAVADTLGFHRAAERCHVSQPTLSTQVQQVEEVLGVRIFERDRRGVLVTKSGEEIIARARRVLADMAEVLSAATRARGEPAHRLQPTNATLARATVATPAAPRGAGAFKPARPATAKCGSARFRNRSRESACPRGICDGPL